MVKTNTVILIILLLLSISALVIACLAYTKKETAAAGGGVERFTGVDVAPRRTTTARARHRAQGSSQLTGGGPCCVGGVYQCHDGFGCTFGKLGDYCTGPRTGPPV